MVEIIRRFLFLFLLIILIISPDGLCSNVHKKKPDLSTGSITVCKLGKVYYFFPANNKSIASRNKRIARAINNYCRKDDITNIPTILLYLFDQDSTSSLKNFEQVLVGYERYECEFVCQSSIFNYNNPSIFIRVSGYDKHFQKSDMAIKYAIHNIDKLKKLEIILSSKKSFTINDSIFNINTHRN